MAKADLAFVLVHDAGGGLQWGSIWVHGAVRGRHGPQLQEPQLPLAAPHLDWRHFGVLCGGLRYTGQPTTGM